ncbi:hypothetical protein WJX81_003368 [Elliptochloris bilobata]|uniref:Uncharacterized protein n=1 Tax=Elliptochloris bilobata TaxID=381761 RepID=A0AAW1QK19_9CHLO
MGMHKGQRGTPAWAPPYKGCVPYRFVRVPGNYYSEKLSFRAACLGASSIEQLCKSIVLVNTCLPPELPDFGTPFASRYMAAGGRLSQKAYNLRLCPEELSERLTGFVHNAVTPIGTATPEMPVVLSHRILKLGT